MRARRNYCSVKKFEDSCRKNVSMEFIKRDIRSVSESIQDSPQKTLPSGSTVYKSNIIMIAKGNTK